MKPQFSRRKRSRSLRDNFHKSSPTAVTRPASGRNSPESTANNVDFPLPDGPMIRATSPEVSSSDTSRKGIVAVSPLPKERRRHSADSTAPSSLIMTLYSPQELHRLDQPHGPQRKQTCHQRCQRRCHARRQYQPKGKHQLYSYCFAPSNQHDGREPSEHHARAADPQ